MTALADHALAAQLLAIGNLKARYCLAAITFTRYE